MEMISTEVISIVVYEPLSGGEFNLELPESTTAQEIVDHIYPELRLGNIGIEYGYKLAIKATGSILKGQESLLTGNVKSDYVLLMLPVVKTTLTVYYEPTRTEFSMEFLKTVSITGQHIKNQVLDYYEIDHSFSKDYVVTLRRTNEIVGDNQDLASVRIADGDVLVIDRRNKDEDLFALTRIKDELGLNEGTNLEYIIKAIRQLQHKANNQGEQDKIRVWKDEISKGRLSKVVKEVLAFCQDYEINDFENRLFIIKGTERNLHIAPVREQDYSYQLSNLTLAMFDLLDELGIENKFQEANKQTMLSYNGYLFMDTDSYSQAEKVFSQYKIFAISYGLEFSNEGRFVQGSWIRKGIIFIKGIFKSKRGKEALKKAKKALELTQLEKKQAEVNKMNTEAAAAFINSIKDIPNVVSIFGSLVVIKATNNGTSRLFTKVLSTNQLIELEKNNELMNNPHELLNRLSNNVLE